MSSAAAAVPPRRAAWRAAQLAGVALLGALLVGLVAAPPLALDLLWNAAVPLLPATFLLNTAIWRNVCPLASLTLLPGPTRGRRTIGERAVRATAIVGILLFLVLVPARRFVFNSDGPVLALTIAAVAVVALAAGFLFQRKAGFCNTICPVHPVERLYGQRPLVQVANVRCVPCLGCTARGCLDRSPSDSARTLLGSARGRGSWLRSPFGFFAAALPGFIVGFYTLGNTDLAGAAGVYGHVALAMAASVAIVLVATTVLDAEASVALPILAAIAVALYYWFAAVAITAAWGLAPAVAWAIRVAALGLAATWLLRALPAARSRAPVAG